jgi:hypothetical protein
VVQALVLLVEDVSGVLKASVYSLLYNKAIRERETRESTFVACECT